MSESGSISTAAKGGCAAAAALVVIVPIIVMMALMGTDAMCDTSTSSDSSSSTSPGHKVWPMKKGTYQLTSPFGPRDGTMHQGQDFGSTAGQPIYAAYDGTVAKSGPASGFGQWIVLSHNIGGKRIDTVYGHMFPQDLLVKAGQKVTAGQLIARVGYNGQVDPKGPGGAHLHFEVWEGGWGQHVIDPKPWLADAKEPGSTASGTAPPAAGTNTTIVAVADWNKIAKFESGGNWAINTGNGYYGGLQFAASTWTGSGGGKYAPTADKATPAEQMEVANTVLRSQGWNAWPTTSRQAGVRDKKPAPAGTFVARTTTSNRQVSNQDAATVQPVAAVTGGETGGSLDVSKPMEKRFGSEAHFQTNTVRLVRAVAQRFPSLKTIGGWRADGGGYSDHPDGRAADIMIPNWDTPQGKALGDRIKAYVHANAALFKVDYSIWRQYYQPAHGAGNVMEDRGSPTQNHFDHVHVTLLSSPLYHGENLGSINDKGGDSQGTTGGGDSCGDTTSQDGGSGAPLKPGMVPAAWAVWYVKAGAVCSQISSSLLAAQGYQETGGFKQRAQSPDAAKGPGQFIDSTWATYGKDYDHDGRIDVFSLGDAIMAQAHFMCDIAAQVDGWIRAGQVDEHTHPGGRRALYLAAYNAGPGAVQESHGFPNKIPRHFTETRPYADIILANEPRYRTTLPDAA